MDIRVVFCVAPVDAEARWLAGHMGLHTNHPIVELFGAANLSRQLVRLLLGLVARLHLLDSAGSPCVCRFRRRAPARRFTIGLPSEVLQVRATRRHDERHGEARSLFASLHWSPWAKGENVDVTVHVQ